MIAEKISNARGKGRQKNYTVCSKMELVQNTRTGVCGESMPFGESYDDYFI